MTVLKRWLPAAAVMAIIFTFSCIPNLAFFSSFIPPEWLKFFDEYSYRIGDKGFFSYRFSFHPDFVLHKIGHVTAYGALGYTLYRATGGSFWKAVLIAALFAASDEAHQYFTPGRSSRFGDVVLDAASAAAGIVAARRGMPCRRRSSY